jgi:hypothetical protein
LAPAIDKIQLFFDGKTWKTAHTGAVIGGGVVFAQQIKVVFFVKGHALMAILDVVSGANLSGSFARFRDLCVCSAVH